MATKKAPAKKKTASTKKAATPAAKSRDLIVIDSSKVGSPAREGEILEVIQGEVHVSYRVRWPDGHQSVVAPVSGSARIVPGSRKGAGRTQA